MNKISFEDFEKIMSYDVIDANNSGYNDCIEIEFEVDNCEIYDLSWMGKMFDKETRGETYWFGLVEDGSQAYDYETFDEFVNAKVFYGEKSLKELWNLVSILSLDGSGLEYVLDSYL